MLLVLSEISVSRARLGRILAGCVRPPSRVLQFYQPVGLVHHRDQYFLDVVDSDGRIQGSVAASEGWAGAMAWTNLHELRRALRQRQDAFACLQLAHDKLLVDGVAISFSDPLQGLDFSPAPAGDLVVFEDQREPVLVLGIDGTVDAGARDAGPGLVHAAADLAPGVEAGAWMKGKGAPDR